MYKIVNDKRLATYTKAIFKETIHTYIHNITILFGSLEALELLLKNFFINLYV